MNKMIYVVLIMITVFSALSALPYSPATPELQERLRTAEPDERIPIIIALSERYDSMELMQASNSLPPQQRRQYTVNELKRFSQDTQHELRQFMQTRSSGIDNVRSLWIANVILCDATPQAIRELSGRSDIRRIDWDDMQNLLDPREWQNARDVEGQREITWNVTIVNADDVWDLGYTGEGITIAVIDTGVNYNHADLADHVWESDDYPYHGYDFINDDNNPMDDHGHGTHCSGTVAGDGTAGSQTGMAPDATIMCLKVLTSTGNGQESAVWEAVEFAVEQGADAFSMSVGWTDSNNPDYESFRDAMVASQAAGVAGAVAAGNEGDYLSWYPIPHNVRVPGCCPPPWLHPDQELTGGTSCVICVGATNSSNSIASFSSLGPCTWEDVNNYEDYPHNPEMGLIRPDIVAPGANIKSLDYSNNNGYEDGWDGTSMATPCVAGVIALMLQKNEFLSPAEIDEILENNRYEIEDEKSNTYGSGRVDALLAIEATNSPNMPPYAPAHPIPENECVYAYNGTAIQWEDGGGTPTEHYVVYVGTDYPPNDIANGVETTDTSYELAGMLDYNSQYYWRIDAVNEFGSTEGNTWTFTTLGEPTESFESGDMESFDWYYESVVPWEICESEAMDGTYSARSGDIPSYYYTELCIDICVPNDSEVSFFKKVSCEDDENDEADRLKFSIDDEEVGVWDGEIDWSYSSFPVTEGEHTLTWSYVKLNNETGGEDCVWIDYIILPPSLFPPTELTATIEDGNDVVLSWQIPSNTEELQGYNVYRDEELVAEIDEPDVLSWGQDDVPNGTYIYTVTAVYTGGESTESNEEEVTIWIANPPTNLLAEVENDNDVVLTWTTPIERTVRNNKGVKEVATRDQLTGFKVYRNEEAIAEIDDETQLTYTDEGLDGGEYTYYVTALYRGTESDPSNEQEVNIVANDNPTAPQFTTRLIGASPNPFNPSTVISFELASSQHVEMTIYNARGQRIRQLVSSVVEPGIHHVTWDGKSDSGSDVGSGVFVYTFSSDRYVSVKKMVLLK